MAQDQFTLNGTPILEDDLREYLADKVGDIAKPEPPTRDELAGVHAKQAQVDEIDAQIADLQEQRSRVLQS